MKCFKCPNDFDDVEAFLMHIQNIHGVKGKSRCVCTLCFSTFGDFSKYKRHIQNCSQNGLATNIDSYNTIIGYEYNEKLENFKDAVQQSALNFMLEMCAKPYFPRNAAFDVIKEVGKFITEMTDGIKLKGYHIKGSTIDASGYIVIGIKTVLSSEASTSSDILLKKCMKTVECAFTPINTERKLTTLLKRRKLTEHLIKIDVASNKRIVPGDTEEYSDDSDEEDAGDEGVVENVIERPKCTLVIMPLAYQIKQFFELPNVFDKVQAHIAAIQSNPHLDHFIKGSVWRKKISNYRDEEVVFPYNFYADGVQFNNPLGPHTKPGLENLNYVTFPTIPPEYQSRLNNIMVASLYEERTIKTFGTQAVFSHIISELKKLAFDGIVLNVNNKTIRVFFLLGIFEGDNKECNRSLDFPDSPSANFYCRFCRMSKEEMKTATEEKIELLRTEENYSDDVQTNNMTLTGVKDWSVFNTVPYFHVVSGTANDLTHDLLEGVLPYSLYNTLNSLIYERNYFTLDQLNERINSFNYGPDSCANKSPSILKDHLTNKKRTKIKMNAAEMFNFTQNLTLMIGNLIPEEDEDGEVDPVWELVKNIVKLLDVSFLPWYEQEDIANLRLVPKSVDEGYKSLYGDLKPVFHFLTHYKTNTERYGALRGVQTIRKEGKHREMKMYTKNTSSRINISLSIAKKVRYQHALRVHSCEGLNDVVTTGKLYKYCIKDKPYFRNIRQSNHRNTISERECMLTDKMVVNGITYKADSWLPDFTVRDNPTALRICDIVTMDPNDISATYFICKFYDKVSYEDHFVAYSVHLGSLHSHLHVISLSDYLVQRQYPVLTHSMNGKEMFRCKRF